MARIYFCQAVVILGVALMIGETAVSGQQVLPTKPKTRIDTKLGSQIVLPTKPKIQLDIKLPDLYIPQGQYCIWTLPTYDYTTGTLSVAVGNKGKATAASSSLRIKEYRYADDDDGWHKDYWASVPSLTVGQQVAIAVKVAKWDGGFNSNGKPIKHMRKWFISVNPDKKVMESDPNNNGCMYVTYK